MSSVGEVLDDGAPPAVDDPLHRLDRSGTGPDVHRQQMVDRVQLLADPPGALQHLTLEALSGPRRADGVCREHDDQNRGR